VPGVCAALIVILEVNVDGYMKCNYLHLPEIEIHYTYLKYCFDLEK
jgi:hypothetical protein